MDQANRFNQWTLTSFMGLGQQDRLWGFGVAGQLMEIGGVDHFLWEYDLALKRDSCETIDFNRYIISVSDPHPFFADPDPT